MSLFLGPVSERTRAWACRVLRHEPPEEFGLGGCAMVDEELVKALCARVEDLEARLGPEPWEKQR
jgi:hypothetical protein